MTGAKHSAIREIRHNGEFLAMIISHRFSEPGIHFLTPDELTLQVGYMKHPQGKKIIPHVHNPVARTVEYTQEVLYIRAGKIRADFYSTEQKFLESHIAEAGDLIILAKGGHGFEALEPLDMIEVKQGPYVGEKDKTRFEAPAK